MTRRHIAIALIAALSLGFIGGSLTNSSAQVTASEVVYVVEPGDSWFAIAAKLDTSPSFLAIENGAKLSTPLFAGRILHHVPTAASSTTTTEVTTSSSSSTTTAPASTTTTGAPATSTTSPSTTVAPTTSAPSTSTSTTTPSTSTTTTSPASTTTPAPTTSAAPTTTQPAGNPACGLAAAVFCETFDAPHNGGTQTGGLDPALWGVSRVGDHNSGGGVLNAITPSHNACAGGGTTGDPVQGDPNSQPFGPATPPPADVQVCGGQMVESVNDGGGVSQLNTYPKQPFNFAGRTGKVVFDLSADSGGTHGAWPEFVITDEPVPGVRRSISFQEPAHATNEVGFALDTGCQGTNTTGVGVVFWTVNGVYNEIQGDRPNCITKGSRTRMNHIEVRVSTTHIEVWGTDAGSTTLKQLAVENISLGFTQGLVWLDDVHYNARKAVEDNGNAIGTQYDHSFAWDNLGFDGPKTYRDLGFDVPYANQCCVSSINGDQEINEGYTVGGGQGPRTFTVTGVDWAQTPTKAKIVFNAYTENTGVSVQVSLNGHTVSVPRAFDGFGVRSIAIDLPASDAVKGANTLKFTFINGFGVVSNASIILVAAAPVP